MFWQFLGLAMGTKKAVGALLLPDRRQWWLGARAGMDHGLVPLVGGKERGPSEGKG